MEEIQPKKRNKKNKLEPPVLSAPRKGQLNLILVSDKHFDETLNNSPFEVNKNKETKVEKKILREPEKELVKEENIEESSLPQQITMFSENQSVWLKHHDTFRNVKNVKDDKLKYFEILKDFHGTYPSETDISCWWDCHPFDSHPIGVPIKYDDKKDIFKVFGCFCSFNCMYAYVLNNYKEKIYRADINFMYKKVTGDDSFGMVSDKISPAPDKAILKKFGGCLTIEQFRNSFQSGVKFNIMFSPLVPVGMYCEQQFNNNKYYIKDGKTKLLEIRKAEPKGTKIIQDLVPLPSLKFT